MRGLIIGLSVFVVIVALACFTVGSFIVGIYNGFVQSSQTVNTTWAHVESQYQRRFDLIPNLVEATKGIFDQEREVFGKIAEARTRYASTESSSPEKVEATNHLESALARLLVIIENYPQLRSSETVLALMDEMAGAENRISVERGRYNEAVRPYNVLIQRFPERIFASLFGFKERTFFKASIEAASAPKVNLSLKGGGK